jgi:hypothetical protein
MAKPRVLAFLTVMLVVRTARSEPVQLFALSQGQTAVGPDVQRLRSQTPGWVAGETALSLTITGLMYVPLAVAIGPALRQSEQTCTGTGCLEWSLLFIAAGAASVVPPLLSRSRSGGSRGWTDAVARTAGPTAGVC